MTTAMQPGGGTPQRPQASGLADVIDTILDKGLVVDAYIRVSLVGIELLTIDAYRGGERGYLPALRRSRQPARHLPGERRTSRPGRRQPAEQGHAHHQGSAAGGGRQTPR